MMCLRDRLIPLALLLAMNFISGCDRTNKPPAPLSAAEIPAAFEKAFGKANPELKDLSTQFVAAVQAQDYSKAFNTVQLLSGRADLDKEQISLVTRASIEVSRMLQNAQAQGDTKAAETLNLYHSRK